MKSISNVTCYHKAWSHITVGFGDTSCDISYLLVPIPHIGTNAMVYGTYFKKSISRSQNCKTVGKVLKNAFTFENPENFIMDEFVPSKRHSSG